MIPPGPDPEPPVVIPPGPDPKPPGPGPGPGPSPIPEPGTWLMMIVGFFGLGSMVRRSRADERARGKVA